MGHADVNPAVTADSARTCFSRVRIYDLASRMVEMSGLRFKTDDQPEGDIEVTITGLRPGEKLFEEMLIGKDPKPTQHARIMKANEEFLAWTGRSCKKDSNRCAWPWA